MNTRFAFFSILLAFGLCFYGLHWAFKSNYSEEISEKEKTNTEKGAEILRELPVTQKNYASLETGLCNYYGTSRSSVSRDSALNRVSFADVQDAVTSILMVAGLPQNFTIKESKLTPFAAARCNKQVDGAESREILYNPWGLGEMKFRTKTQTSIVSILAHEIGHHLIGHTLSDNGSTPNLELEADKYSGNILAKMGYGLEDALVAIKMFPTPASSTHPSTLSRIKAITEGWNEGKAYHSSSQSYNQKTDPFIDPGPYFGAGPTLPKTNREILIRKINFQRTLEVHKYHMEKWRQENPSHPKSRNPNWSDADKERWIRWHYTGRHPAP